MPLTFAYGATTLTFRSQRFGDRHEIEKLQTRSRTHDGLLMVGNKEIEIQRFALNWNGLTDANKASIDTFFDADHVDGSMHSFTYTDADGDQHAVRLLDDTMVWTNYFTDQWSVSMVLEREGPVAGS